MYFYSSKFNELLVFNFILKTFCINFGFNVGVKSTLVYNIFNGFSFAGWKFLFFHNKKVLNLVSLEEIRAYKRVLKYLVTKFNSSDVFLLLKKINSLIFEWVSNRNLGNYPWDISNELDIYLYKLIWKFVRKRHSRKSNIWVYNKYWKFLSDKWRFFIVDKITGNLLFLRSHNSGTYKIYRLPAFINFFDSLDNEMYYAYWFNDFSIKNWGIYKTLFLSQHGICPICKKNFNLKSFFLIKICKLLLPKFGTNKISSLVLIHNYCSF